MEPPCTPSSKKTKVEPSLNSPALTLPATPFLSRLGYGTGVSVFLYQRSPALGAPLPSPWAVKKVNRRHAESQFGERLAEEAEVLRSLTHPNIIQYKGWKPGGDGIHALMMEHGHRSLQDLLGERDQSLPASSIVRVSADMASALHYLHTDKHILHGDIKSGNVLIVGDCETAKLCDFGVTVPLDSEGKAIKGKVYVGTEAWSPREVLMGDQVITTKADMFAFGLVIFEMISLHSPHIDKLDGMDGEEDEEDFDEEESEAAFMAALGTRPPLPDTVDLDNTYRRVLEIFFSCTEILADKRPSAAEVLELLEGGEDEEDNSILCVNMIQADEEEKMVEEGDESIICLDDTCDAFNSVEDSLGITPSAV